MAMSHDPETSKDLQNKQSNCTTSDQNDQRNNNAISKTEKTTMAKESTKRVRRRTPDTETELCENSARQIR